MDTQKRLGPPYGPPANIKATIDHWRDRSMPEQVTKEWFERVGLSPNLAPRNLHGLRYLGLVDASGHTTEAANRLRTASSEEYQGLLEAVVREAYSSIFEFTNPAEDTRARVEDAFRREEPSAQRGRMVTCFLGLCALAGIPLRESASTRDRTRSAPQATQTTPDRRPSARHTKRLDTKRNVVREAPPGAPLALPAAPSRLPMDPALSALADKLREIRTTDEFDEWATAYRPLLAFVSKLRES
jgi:hypothetical protein